MSTQLAYVIQFVSDMDQSIHFYSETLGFRLLFQSPDWSEFATGETRLALHPASQQNPPGKVQLGFHVPDLQDFYRAQTALGVQFTQVPAAEGGSTVARFIGPDGLEYSVSAAQ
jgi:catechol 2,3-dioxygenase-like lactoylglutathione lyase family enzyme